MRYVPLIYLAALCFLSAGCKKQLCNDVVCEANAVCVNGICHTTCGVNHYLDGDTCRIVCRPNYYVDGDTCHIICGPNQHAVGNTCLCDTDWIGNCDIPIGLLAGRYHVKGSYYSFVGGSVYSSNFESDITIKRTGDTLFYGSTAYTYATHTNTPAYFTFEQKNLYPGNYNRLYFKRTLDDSVFYAMETGGMGGGNGSSFVGVKLR